MAARRNKYKIVKQPGENTRYNLHLGHLSDLLRKEAVTINLASLLTDVLPDPHLQQDLLAMFN